MVRWLALACALAACSGEIGRGDDDDDVIGGADADPSAPDADPSAPDAAPAECPASGPAYVHGDLWAYWHNYRVACDRQHKWLWICERRLGAEACGVERQRFEDCWNAAGEFPVSTWDGSTPAPSSPNYGVCQPHHWPEKNDPARRPGNEVPCDTRTFDYDALRTADPRYGVDWWAGGTSMRHLTVKVFDQGQNPQAQEGQADGLVALSTHPGDYAAFMNGLANHGGGCLPTLTGGGEDPYPAQSFGAFFWVPVPTDRPVTLAASWIGPIGDDLGTACLNLDVFGFPGSFAAHAVDGKPWFISSPCWDLQTDVQLEPGHHYVWDVLGFRDVGCSGPPGELLSVAQESERAALVDGSCSD